MSDQTVTSDNVVELAEERYREKVQGQVALQTKLEELQGHNKDNLELAINFIRDQGNPELATALEEFETKQELLKASLKLAKDEAEAAKSLFSLAVLSKADGLLGRGIHPNVNIINSREIAFPEDPAEFGRAMAWLVANGQREVISVKLKLSTMDSYVEQGRVPKNLNGIGSLVTIRSQPATRIDAPEKWALTQEADND